MDAYVRDSEPIVRTDGLWVFYPPKVTKKVSLDLYQEVIANILLIVEEFIRYTTAMRPYFNSFGDSFSDQKWLNIGVEPQLTKSKSISFEQIFLQSYKMRVTLPVDSVQDSRIGGLDYQALSSIFNISQSFFRFDTNLLQRCAR